MTEISTVVEVILGLGTAFGGGFAVGKYLEKSANEIKQLKAKIEEIEKNFSRLPLNHKLNEWAKNNASQLMEFIDLMTKEERK